MAVDPSIIDEGVAIIAAAVIAIVGIYYTAKQQRRMLRKQHTFQVIEKLNNFDVLEEKLKDALYCIDNGLMLREASAQDLKYCESLDFIFNYYEFLAGAIICGDIDEELMFLTEKARFIRYFLYFMPYVQGNRSRRNEHSMWENLEFIVFRWEFEKKDSVDIFLDKFTGRPNVRAYPVMRPEIWEKLSEVRIQKFPNAPNQ